MGPVGDFLDETNSELVFRVQTDLLSCFFHYGPRGSIHYLFSGDQTM